ncbi:MAG: hypothetical protein IT472_09480 [Thermomonas sp.]|uniref:hypothetical protein n=1 Tax=Thermomonas sp. TaxID=1971895 RepID=UPI00260E102A|nr:hypothetical protein [Thermomonas sp.]MCC7097394.1 hypothetical protein [Thermomonas sp.]
MLHLGAKLKRQDWVAVAIELVVLVLGVFLGVQATNWNSAREENQRSAMYTARLKEDLRVEAWNLEAQIGYNEQVLANAERAADALSGKVPLADEALLVAAYRASQYLDNQHRRATFDELISTGEIGLIRDPSLRTLAVDVYTQPQVEQIAHGGRQSEFRRMFRMAVPFRVQQVIAASCGDRELLLGDYARIRGMLDYPCTTTLDPASIAASAAILRGDPRILAMLQLRIAELSTDIDGLTGYLSVFIRKPLQRLVAEGQSRPASPLNR